VRHTDCHPGIFAHPFRSERTFSGQAYLGPVGRASRLFWVVVRLPVPVFGLLFGREWFAEPGTATTMICGDILSEAHPGAIRVQ